MEDGGRQPGVNAGVGEQLRKMLHAAGAAAGDDGNADPRGQRVQHFQIEAVFHAVGVDGVQHDLTCAGFHAPHGPVHGVNAGVLPAALGKQAELPVYPLDVHAQHHALVAVFLCRRSDQARIGNGAGVDADLVCAAFQHPVKIIQRADAAAYRQGDEDLAGDPTQDACEQSPPLHGGGDVVKHQLVRAGGVVEMRQLHGVRHIPQTLKVGSLYHPSVPDVQTGNDALG